MTTVFDHYNGETWEEFCENMLRHHYGPKNFYLVPAKDGGDHGIEFYTSCGTIYQCYFPDPSYDVKTWKTKVQEKINTDLKKLKKDEFEIQKMLNGIIINQWVLLTPRNDSKELNKYCAKKTNEIKKQVIGFIDKANFVVKVERDNIFPKSRIFALSVQSGCVHIPIPYISNIQKDTWINEHTEFTSNIDRKSEILKPKNKQNFKDNIVEKYIQIDTFLDTLRNDYPDLFDLIEDTARAQLCNIEDKYLLSNNIDDSFSISMYNSNIDFFKKHEKQLSTTNHQILPFGYMAKWIAECNLDFICEKDED